VFLRTPLFALGRIGVESFSNHSMIKNVSVLGQAEYQSPKELNPGCSPTHMYNVISIEQACIGTSCWLISKQGRDKWHTEMAVFIQGQLSCAGIDR
jgi:hypothetical protein